MIGLGQTRFMALLFAAILKLTNRCPQVCL